MNHPTDEQWMDYLYAEATPEQRTHMDDHLKGCPHCQNQLRQYAGTQATLDTWQLPAQPSTRPLTRNPFVLWSAKAAALPGPSSSQTPS